MSTTDTPTSTPSESTDPLGPLLGTLWGFVPARVIACAYDAGFFSLFGCAGDRVISVIELRDFVNWAPRPTEIALKILAQIGLVTQLGNDEWVALTEQGKKWFRSGSNYNIGGYFPRQQKLERAYEHLERVLQCDFPNEAMAKETVAAFGADETATKDFMLTMNAAALEFAPDFIAVLTSQLAADGEFTILDIGCGLGTLSIFLSDAFQRATVEAFDLPGVSDLADEYIRERSPGGRIRVRSADWRAWAWREQCYDLVILSQVLHEFAQTEAEELFKKAFCALKPGGLLVTVIVGDATVPGGDYVHRLFAMNILVETGGDNPSAPWLAKMEGALRMQCTYFHRIAGSRSLWVGRKLI